MYGSLMIDVASTALTEDDVAILTEPEVGGIILFARNVDTPEQVRRLCDSIRKKHSLLQNTNPNSVEQRLNQTHDLLIGVDQEGGRVARLRQGFTPLPAMGTIGKLFDTQPKRALALAYDCGYLMAAEVLSVGIDISFAPILDIDGISQVIGDRSFHNNVDTIVSLSTQFMQGMHAAGMATTGKHFPGHGSIAPDSHVADAIDIRSYAAIDKQDLQPFIRCMPHLDALMPAHVIFSDVDDKPAGFSKIWLKDIARQKLGFEGVIFSDDLSMKAAHVVGGVGERVKSALTAGCDMALVCNDRAAAWEAVIAAKKLPTPNQQRMASMSSKIPAWQGSLEATSAQFEYWEQARDNVLSAFFSESNKPCSETDPTQYNI